MGGTLSQHRGGRLSLPRLEERKGQGRGDDRWLAGSVWVIPAAMRSIANLYIRHPLVCLLYNLSQLPWPLNAGWHTTTLSLCLCIGLHLYCVAVLRVIKWSWPLENIACHQGQAITTRPWRLVCISVIAQFQLCRSLASAPTVSNQLSDSKWLGVHLHSCKEATSNIVFIIVIYW